MRTKLLAIGSTLLLVAGLISVGAGPASADNDGQVCADFSSGKINVDGSHKTLDVTAPAGKLIDGYCIKAGSVNKDLGPKWVDVDPPVASLTISYPAADKDISHYALRYIDVVVPPTDVCPNITDAQATIPDGMVLDNAGNCVVPPPPAVVHPTASISVQCGTATVTFTNGTKFAFAGDVRVDGEAPSHVNYYGLGDFYQIVNIPPYGTATKTVNFAEDSGTHTVAYRIGLGAEQDWYVPWQTAQVESDCLPPVVTQVCDVATSTVLVTNLNTQGFQFEDGHGVYVDTRADGRYQFVDGALRLYTVNPISSSSTNKIQMMKAVNIPVKDFGTLNEVLFTLTSGAVEPGTQVRVDVTGDGISDATLVGEDIYTEEFWTNTAGILPASAGGQGGSYAGDLNDLLAVYPNATVVAVGVSLGSGVLADGNLTKLQLGCTDYTFDYETITASLGTPTVTDVCGTENDGTPVYPADSTGVTWKTSSVVTMPNGDIRYRVVATPIADYVIPAPGEGDDYKIVDGKAVWLLYTTDEPCPPTVIKPVKPDVSVSDVCDVSGDSLVVTSEQEGVAYEVTWNKAHTVAKVTATATDGYVFANNKTQKVWRFAFTNEPCPIEVTPADPLAQDQLCVNGETTPGSIWVDLKEGVAYTIDGQAVTEATTTVEPGTYVVQATALDGYVLSGESEWSYSVTVGAAQACGQLDTHPLVTPVVTWKNLTCDAAGSYTLADIEGVLWSVDGKSVAAGTYAVDSAKTVHITAAADGPDFGFEFEAQTDWTLEFSAAKDCPQPQLTTLALADTGVDGGGINLGLLFSSSLVLLGGALLYAERRLRFGRN